MTDPATRDLVCFASAFAYEGADNITHLTLDGVHTACGRTDWATSAGWHSNGPDCKTCRKTWARIPAAERESTHEHESSDRVAGSSPGSASPGKRAVVSPPGKSTRPGEGSGAGPVPQAMNDSPARRGAPTRQPCFAHTTDEAHICGAPVPDPAGGGVQLVCTVLKDWEHAEHEAGMPPQSPSGGWTVIATAPRTPPAERARRAHVVDWTAMTPAEVFDALKTAPRVASPWTTGPNTHYRLRPDGLTAAIEGGYGCQIMGSMALYATRGECDEQMRKRGWLLVESPSAAETEGDPR